MKSILVLIFTFFILTPSYAQFVEFEDENFKAYLIGLGIDTDGDGEIHESEAGEVTTLHIENSGATSVVGIQSFTNLVELSSVDSEIEVIDVSNMIKLEDIKVDSDLNTQQLIAQYCTALTSISEYSFQMELELLDLTGCTGLIDQYFYSNIANTIILKDCTNLKSLVLEGGGVLYNQGIDLSGCSSLSQINVDGVFDEIDVSGLASLQNI